MKLKRLLIKSVILSKYQKVCKIRFYIIIFYYQYFKSWYEISFSNLNLNVSITSSGHINVKKFNHIILTKRNIPNCFSSIIWKLILGLVFSRSFPQVWHYYIWKNFIWESKKIKKYFFHQNPVDLTQFVQFAEAAKSLRTFGLKWKTKKTKKWKTKKNVKN